jgi:hypothetical protein
MILRFDDVINKTRFKQSRDKMLIRFAMTNSVAEEGYPFRTMAETNQNTNRIGEILNATRYGAILADARAESRVA